MKLSESTLAILGNFAAIQPNLAFKPGKTIQTITASKNIMASASIEESIPSEFGIYDLSNLLGTLSLLESPEIEVKEDSLVITEGGTSIRYFFAPLNLLCSPTRTVAMPKADVTFLLSEAVLGKVRRASAVLKHDSLRITGDKGVVSLKVVDPKNSTANTYSTIVDTENECTDQFSFVLDIGNLKFLPGDYEVSLSSRMIGNFKNLKTYPVEYWIALDKTSTFGNAKKA